MQVRDEDGLDRVRVDVEAVETDQYRGTAVDQKAAAAPIHLIAGLQSAARAEGIAATDDSKLHGLSPARSGLGARPHCHLRVPSGEVSKLLRTLDARRLHEIDRHQGRDVGNRVLLPGQVASV